MDPRARICPPRRHRPQFRQRRGRQVGVGDVAELPEILRRKAREERNQGLGRATENLVAALAKGILADKHAVQGATATAGPDGQAEGLICKLKRQRVRGMGEA